MVRSIAMSRQAFLVETEWLAEHLHDPGVRVLECTVYLHPADLPGGFRVESGRERWSQGHIPGAGFVDLHEELSDKTSSLRFMLPPPDQFAAAMGRHGVGEGVRVVLYDRSANMWAARVWWMRRVFGLTSWRIAGASSLPSARRTRACSTRSPRSSIAARAGSAMGEPDASPARATCRPATSSIPRPTRISPTMRCGRSSPQPAPSRRSAW